MKTIDSARKNTLCQVRIMVVDDDRDSLELIQFLCEEDQAIVCTALTALEALEKIASFQPEVLISDIAMPNFDGLFLIDKIRSCTSFRCSHIKAIALTAFADKSYAKETIAAGFDRYIAKPFDLQEFVETIKDLIAS